MTDTADTTTMDPDERLVRDLTAQLLAENPPATTDLHEFLGAQYDLGLAWTHFPKGWGGLGVNPRLNKVVLSELGAVGAPIGAARNLIGYGMCAPAVMTHGTDQQRGLLRALFTCENIWCQLFSEPGAGSDVASLSTKAERDGDEWVLNGQKVWTTLAHVASYGLIVARTDPEQPKHRGLTAFIVDMSAPGVEVRPLRQMTGEAEFNEVYFTDARIPDAWRVDDVGRGWAVAITTLMNERVSIGGQTPPRGSGPIAQLMDVFTKKASQNPVLRDQVMRAWIEAEVNRLTNLRAAAAMRIGTPGPEGSVSKLAMAETTKRIYELAVDAMGAEGMLYGKYAMEQHRSVMFGDDVAKNFLRARANSIEGGTSEVMRNILGERVLGLPGDVRVDKELPWSQVPRS